MMGDRVKWLMDSLDETPMEERCYKQDDDKRVIIELGSSELVLLPDGHWFMDDVSGG